MWTAVLQHVEDRMCAGWHWTCDKVTHLCSTITVTLSTSIKPGFSFIVMQSIYKKPHQKLHCYNQYYWNNDMGRKKEKRKEKKKIYKYIYIYIFIIII